MLLVPYQAVGREISLPVPASAVPGTYEISVFAMTEESPNGYATVLVEVTR